MTIRKKMIVGFAVIYSIALILGATGLISMFRISNLSQQQTSLQSADASISEVLTAHYTWRQSLTESVMNGSEFTGSLDPQACALGKWLAAEEQNVTDAEILNLLKQVDAPHHYIHTEAKVIVDYIKAGKSDQAEKVLIESVLPKASEAIDLLSKISDRYGVLVVEKTSEITTAQLQITIIIAVMVLLATIISLTLAASIIRSVMRPMQMVTAAAKAIAIGELDMNMSYHIDDEIGSLVKSVQHLVESSKQQALAAQALASGNLTVHIQPRSEKDVLNISLQKMIDSLGSIFSSISVASSQVSAGSGQVADGSQMLANGSVEQAGAIDKLSISMSEISQKTLENSEMANEAASLATTIKTNAEKGSSQMEQMIIAVQEINEASTSIGKVIKVIDDIAFQTNILALNAAVEAARAGQHGKGFAVVADEVRNLAAKSAEAAKDTSGLISNSIQKALQGSQIATDTAGSLLDIVSGINRSTEVVGKIASSSNAQSLAIENINAEINQVALVVQQNSATAEQSAAAAQQLSAQSTMLEQLIARFKLKDDAHTPFIGNNSYARKPAHPSPPTYNTAMSMAKADPQGNFDTAHDDKY